MSYLHKTDKLKKKEIPQCKENTDDFETCLTFI